MARSIVFVGEKTRPEELERQGGLFRFVRRLGEKNTGPAALVNCSKVLLVAGMGLSQLVMGFAGKHDPGIALSAGVLLAGFLGSAGLFLGACIWGELRGWNERRP